jgi:osmotically-inducible protein OsmY
MNKKWLALILAPTLLLSGCIPAALVVGATAGGAILYDQRSLKQVKKDRDATYIADKRLADNHEIAQKCHISVATYYGIMLIVGQAPTTALKQKAYQLVSNIPNVSRIYNEITIAAPTSIATRTEDTWITTKVKSKMLAQSNLHASDIKVVTEDGVVYLLGKVSHRQADLAASVARRVDGVKKVVMVFEYPH